MSKETTLSCGFMFPTDKMYLYNEKSICYISDNALYQLDLSNFQTQISRCPTKRSYQSMTCSSKRGLLCLADYGKNPNIYFYEAYNERQPKVINNVTQLEIQIMQISLDNKYLAVGCGVPEYELKLINIAQQRLIIGPHATIKLPKSKQKLLKDIKFNPGDSSIIALQIQKKIIVYEITECFLINKDGQTENVVNINQKLEIQSDSKIECFIWDQLNNIYYSNSNKVVVVSTDTNKQLLAYDLQHQGDSPAAVVSCLVLTQRHLLIFFKQGKIQWINKYYPDAMEQEDITQRPFYLDKKFVLNRIIKQALFNGDFTQIYAVLQDGYFCILHKPAQSNDIQEEQDQNQARRKRDNQKTLEINVEYYGPFHTHQILAIAQVPQTSSFLTVARNGRITLWSSKLKRAMNTFDTKQQIQSAHFNPNATILAAGLTNGILKFYSVTDIQKTYLFKQFRMIMKGSKLKFVKFNTNGDQLVTVDEQKCYLFYFLTKIGVQFELLGRIRFQQPITSLCWANTNKNILKPQSQNVVVSVKGNILYLVCSPPPIPTRKRANDLQLNCQTNACLIDCEPTLVNISRNGQILVTTKSKCIFKYKQPQISLTKFDVKIAPITLPLQQGVITHNLPICCLQTSNESIISLSQDGIVQIHNQNDLKKYIQTQVYGWRGIRGSVLCQSSDGKGLFIGGNNGSLFVFNASSLGAQSRTHPPLIYTQIQSLGDKLLFYEAKLEQQYLHRMKDVIMTKKKKQIDRLDNIKKDLRSLLVQNQTHQQLQKLDRDQFVIDLESRQQVAAKGRDKCAQIRQQSKQLILKNQVYAKKLKLITWDRMIQHLRAINGLKQNYIVYNYQLRKVNPYQKRKLQLIIDLRRLQSKEKKKKAALYAINIDFYSNKFVVNSGLSQTLIINQQQRKQEKKDDKNKKKKQQQQQIQQNIQTGQQIFFEQQWNLLYSSFELYSPQAKINQIIMMQNIILKIKQVFNKQFEDMLKFRSQQNEIISDKNKRIIQICQQLKRQSEIIVGFQNYYESSEHILKVNPSQVPFKRHLSKQQRERLQKQRQKQQQRLRKLAEDDSSQRALSKMMGGTLEQKKTSVLQINVQRQKWMDKPVEDMNQEQKLKMKQYQVKKLKAQQQKQRIVKKLQAQLRKLKIQIQQIIDKFDQKLFALLKRRIQYDYRISQQQLYCANLALSIHAIDESNQQKQILNRKKIQFKHRLQQCRQEIQKIKQLSQDIEQKKKQKKAALDIKKLGELQSKIKTIQKNVFQEYNTNPKKRREMQQKLMQTDPKAKRLLVKLDPFRQIQSRLLATQKGLDFNFFVNQIKILQQTYDIPQGSLVQILQNRFKVRHQQAQFDKKIHIAEQMLNKLVNQQSIIQSELQNSDVALQALQQQRQRSKSDLLVQVRLKQGQVEINANTPVPDLQDALLLAKTDIEERNTRIMANASQKIQVMQKIKVCKISVTEETLNLEKKQQHIQKLNSQIKQIQMLKVKKQMQVALTKKDARMNQNQIKSLKEQIQKVHKQADKRISLFEKKIQKISHEIDAIRKENKQLQLQKWNRLNTVMQRQKIKQMMIGQTSDNVQDATLKFQRIAINRKLFDQAKQQTQEIQLLRQELAKLKAKTFANFSNVQR